MIPLIFIVVVSLYAYRVNTRKVPGDPSKRDYSPFAPWITPVSLPLLLIFNLIVFVLSSLAFGIFLVLFSFALILFRGPIIFKWIRDQALKFGNFILKGIYSGLNMVRNFFKPPYMAVNLIENYTKV
jgi:hypothetical protein